jgi:hypothetical protein
MRKNPDTEQAEALRKAMRDIGELWGLPRSITPAELGRALRLGPDEPGKSVAGWLNGRHRIPASASVAVEMFLLGALPPDGLRIVLPPSALKGKPRAPRASNRVGA